jgi:hypothetical protein
MKLKSERHEHGTHGSAASPSAKSGRGKPSPGEFGITALSQQFMAGLDPRALGALGGWVLHVGALLFFAALMQTPQQWAITGIVVLVGSAVGWIIGVIISPYNEGERSQFGAYIGAVAAFGSGYLLGEIRPLLAQAFGQRDVLTLIGEHWLHGAAFIIALIASMLYTHAIRAYSPHAEQQLNSKVQQDTSAVIDEDGVDMRDEREQPAELGNTPDTNSKKLPRMPIVGGDIQ